MKCHKHVLREGSPAWEGVEENAEEERAVDGNLMIRVQYPSADGDCGGLVRPGNQ